MSVPKFQIAKVDNYILKTWQRHQQIDVSFLCVCPLIDDKLRHNIVKMAVEQLKVALKKLLFNKRLHKIKILSVSTPIDAKNAPISARQFRQLL